MMLAPSPVAGAQYNNKEVKNNKKKANKQSSRSRSKKLDKSSTSESFVKKAAVTASKSIISDEQLNQMSQAEMKKLIKKQQ
jgi:hypothetical protein